jgi:hypothetical protein
MLALCSDALFESRILYPSVSPKQNYISATSRLLPFACCLSWPCESYACLGFFKLYYLNGLLGSYHMLYLIYEMDMNWRLVGYKMLKINMI